MSDATVAPTRPITVQVPVRLTAVVRPEPDGGFSAEVPALPGCRTEGDTLDEAWANLRDAAEGWLASAGLHPVFTPKG